MRLTLKTKCKIAAVSRGRRQVGSAMARLLNHNAPPVSSPGTGSFAIPRSKTNVPYPTKTCTIGTKLFHNLTPALRLIICNSLLAAMVAALSPFLLRACIFSIIGLTTGCIVARRAALSAAPMYGFNRMILTMTAVRAMEHHHGVPA